MDDHKNFKKFEYFKTGACPPNSNLFQLKTFFAQPNFYFHLPLNPSRNFLKYFFEL